MSEKLKIIALADIHGSLDYLDRAGKDLADCDLILLAGDITNFGNVDSIRRVVAGLGKFNKRMFAVPGNCDPPAVNDYLSKKKINLHCNCIITQEYGFFGVGGSLPCAELTPFESGEHGFISLLEKVEKAVMGCDRRILVTHQPPWGTKIDVISNKHTGSTAIRDFILEHEPMLAISGHVHEASGTDKLGKTTLVNPGPFRNGCYAWIEVTDKVKKVDLRYAG